MFVPGLFQNAYNTFFCKGDVVLLVIGAYVETNKDSQYYPPPCVIPFVLFC